MLKAAKLLLIDPDEKYLLMYRSDHPVFGTDPDLPGGVVEDGESLVEATLREVQEEIGVELAPEAIREVYTGAEYSVHNTYYALFAASLDERPEVTMSWEHSSYEWLDRETFLSKCKGANDTYMHMVYDKIK